MRRITAVLTLSAVMLLGAIAQAGEIDKIVGGTGDQYRPSSNGVFLAWSDYRDGHSRVLARRLETGDTRRVNAPGTRAWMGTLVQSNETIVYQQVKRCHSDLWEYDVSDRERLKLAGDANSPEWEWLPTASADWVLFLRDVLSRCGEVRRTDLLLENRATGNVRTLIRDLGSRQVVPGWAGTDRVAWTACGRRTCNVWIYEPSSGELDKLLLPKGKVQYAPAADESSDTIFFVRSGLRCGRNVVIRRASLSDPGKSAPVFALPDGIDTDWIASLEPNSATSGQDYLFSRVPCRNFNFDVYAIPSVTVMAPQHPAHTKSSSKGAPKQQPWAPAGGSVDAST